MRTTVVLVLLAAAFASGFATNALLIKPLPVTQPHVTGIGGVFFKAKNPKELKAWYRKHLGFNIDAYGTAFEWREGADSSKYGFTQWSLFKETTTYFEPSKKDFMINYRVKDLTALQAQLQKDTVVITDSLQAFSYGKFLHIMDAEGNKIELWEPVDTAFLKVAGSRTK
ncbi:MAG: VOC family protein [Chitinophagales bacterium]